MTTPGLTCAHCRQPLYPHLTRPTDTGLVHAHNLGCTIITAQLAREPLPQIIARLYTAGASIRQLEAATGLSNRQVRRHLSDTGTKRREASRYPRAVPDWQPDELAYDGGWVRVGLIWKPRQIQRKDVA